MGHVLQKADMDVGGFPSDAAEGRTPQAGHLWGPSTESGSRPCVSRFAAEAVGQVATVPGRPAIVPLRARAPHDFTRGHRRKSVPCVPPAA